MRTVELQQATDSLAAYTRFLPAGPMVVTQKGKPVWALVPIRNADWETVTLSNHPQFLKLIAASRRKQKHSGGISSQEMRRRLGLKQSRRVA